MFIDLGSGHQPEPQQPREITRDGLGSLWSQLAKQEYSIENAVLNTACGPCTFKSAQERPGVKNGRKEVYHSKAVIELMMDFLPQEHVQRQFRFDLTRDPLHESPLSYVLHLTPIPDGDRTSYLLEVMLEKTPKWNTVYELEMEGPVHPKREKLGADNPLAFLEPEPLCRFNRVIRQTAFAQEFLVNTISRCTNDMLNGHFHLKMHRARGDNPL